jgi:hypothetical protein
MWNRRGSGLNSNTGHASAFARYNLGVDNPLFSALLNNSSISNLSQALTINGITVQPSFRYEAKNATTTGWTATVGPDLATASSGTDIQVGRDTPLLDSADKAVRVMNGEVYQCATDEDAHDIGTEDFVFEWFGSTSATGVYCSKYLNNITPGWYLGGDSGNAVKFYIYNGTSSIFAGSSGAALEGWTHFICFCDRSEGSTNGFRGYINGVLVRSENPSSFTAALSNTSKFTIGSHTALTSKQNDTSDQAYMAMYKQADWFAGGAQNATDFELIARTRCSQLAGVVATRTSDGYSLIPSTVSRTTAAFQEKYDSTNSYRRLYYMASNWPRIDQRPDIEGTLRTGYRAEIQSTNGFSRSTELSHTIWTKTNIASLTTAQRNSDTIWPTTVSTAYNSWSWKIIPDATLGKHGISMARTLTAALYSLSIFGKADGYGWISLENSTVGCSCTFDLANGVVGTTVGSCTGFIEPYGNGWFRCWINYTGTAASHTLLYQAAIDTNNTDYSGDGSTSYIKVFGPQNEIGQPYEARIGPSSFIYTSGGDTRNSDCLEYTLGALDSPVTVELDTVGSNVYDFTYSSVISRAYFVSLTDSTNTNDAHWYGTTISTYPYLPASTVVVAAANEGYRYGTTRLQDGYQYALKYTTSTSEMYTFVDGVREDSTYNYYTQPINSSLGGSVWLTVGCQRQGYRYYSGGPILMSNIKVWNKIK